MPITKAYIAEIKQILREARNKAFTAVNYAMVETYWLIGKRIVEEIQQGKHRANYGDQVIKNISKALTAEFGKDFSERSIRQYRQFYQMFPKLSIRRSVIAISDKSAGSKTNSANSVRQINPPALEYALNCSHIQRIMRVSYPEVRAWYLCETVEQSWDFRTLDRNIRRIEQPTQLFNSLLHN